MAIDQKKRQTILLVLVGIAVVGYLLLMLLDGNGSQQQSAEEFNPKQAQEILKTVTTLATKDKPSTKELYILAAAEKDWLKSPFYQRREGQDALFAVEQTSVTDGAEITFTYSGFVKLGNRKLAIVNGMEYGKSEQLEEEGFFVSSISPYKVELEQRDASGKVLGKLLIPIEAEEE